MNKKIYCNNCKYKYEADGFVRYSEYCLHPDNVKFIDTPCKRWGEYQLIKNINANNDCQCFEEKFYPQGFWAKLKNWYKNPEDPRYIKVKGCQCYLAKSELKPEWKRNNINDNSQTIYIKHHNDSGYTPW